jgi:hypothetical protein
MAKRFKTFQDLLDVAADAAPGAGKFIGRLIGESRNAYLPGNPEARVMRDLRDVADARVPEGLTGFREALRSVARPDTNNQQYVDAVADRSSVVNELLRAAPSVVASTPDEMRIANQAAMRARAIPVFNRQPQDVRDILLNMAGASPRGLRPGDILTARSIAQKPEDVREIALALVADGMAPREALETARMLAQ